MGFFELNVAMSGIFAAQRGLQVTSNNITNASTKGYSRQELNQQASTPLSGIGVGMTGTGVSTTGINRVRDSYIDMKIWSQNPKLGEYNVKVTQNSIVESAFGEPSDTGFTAVFNDLFTGLSNLSTDPSSDTNKVALKEEMISFTKYYNNITSTLESYQQNLNFDIKNTVNEINDLATRIQSLNAQIMNAEIYGDEANSFRDERDHCIDRLSEIIDIEVTESEYAVEGSTINKLTIKASGQTLVDHLNYNTLEIQVRDEQQQAEGTQLYDIVWRNGMPFDATNKQMSGELKGMLDMRDGGGTGQANDYPGIPYYIQRMDDYVRQFAETMNEAYSKTADGLIQIHKYSVNNKEATYVKKESSGNMTFYDEKKEIIAIAKTNEKGERVLLEADGTSLIDLTSEEVDKLCSSYATAYALFTYTTDDSKGEAIGAEDLTDYSKITSTNFSISKELLDDATNMRTLYDDANPSDTSFILNLLSQKNNKEMFKEGDPKDYMIAIFAELGINAKESEMYQSTQTSVVTNLTNQRLSVSQVDISEEFTYLIQYQQAYQAAAKVMNTMDGIYETTLFKLGNF